MEAEAVAAPSATGASLCAHCSLPVPPGLVEPGKDHQFCCAGCSTAYAIIHTCGLERYYALLQERGEGGVRASTGTRAFDEFDNDVFRTLYVKGTRGGVCTCELYLQGVHCGACVWLVERLPKLAQGVLSARLDLRRAMVTVCWDDSKVRLSQAARVLDRIGYTPHPARDAKARDLRRREDRQHLIRIAVAGACAGNVMLMAIALYSGALDWIEPGHRELFRWASMAITLVSLAWPGSVFFRSAWNSLRAGSVHLDVPIAVALGAGAAWSIYTTITGVGEIFYDSMSMLVLALLVGRFIQHRQQRWSVDAIGLLFSLTPSSARLVEPAGVREVPVEALHEGDVIETLAGDSFAADGEVIQGATSVDQSLLTGESRPVRVSAGQSIAAGSVNLDAPIRVRVRATGEQSRVGKLMRLVEDSAQHRAPIVLLADKAAGWFVAAMFVLAGVTLAIWLFRDPMHAVDHAVALLVVTCPCALGLATPLAMTIALGRAAKTGVLIKGGESLQRLASGGTIYLDKTGTITFGSASVVAWEGDRAVRPLVLALEAASSHPLARAIARDLAGEVSLPASEVAQTVGGGIEGVVHERVVRVGSAAFVGAGSIPDPRNLAGVIARIASDGQTPVCVSVDRVLSAVIGLGDAVRPDAGPAITEMQRLGWRVGILSGDDPRTVARVASGVGVDPAHAFGAISPEGKLRHVRETPGGVVMIGDGVNDAAALAAAGVGIAVHGGAEASLAAADIYVNRPGLEPIVGLLEGASRTMGVVRLNLAVSVAYNVLAAGGAMLGLIGPLVAAVLMPLSSLTVLALSVRGRTFGAPR